jgi:hypothetical protein
LTIGGCSHSGNQATPRLADGALAWGSDNCQYKYWQLSKQWLSTGWCRKFVGPAVSDLSLTNSLWYRVDDSDPEVHAVYDYITRLWTGQSTRTGEMLVSTAHGWLTLTDAVAAAQRDAQQRGQSCGIGGTNPCAIEARSGTNQASQVMVSRAEVEAQMAEWQTRMGRIWTQPECNFSYNGCR